MKRRLYTLASRHANALNLTRNGLKILAVLALALTLLGANPSGSAQAAPPASAYVFLVNAIPSAEYVCVGEYMYFTVSISRQLANQPGDTGVKMGIVRGVIVNSSIKDTSVITTIDEAVKIESGGANPNSVKFWFKAGDKPGKTLVKFFSKNISEYYLEASPQENIGFVDNAESPYQTVDVRKCSYEVLMFTTAPVPGIGLWLATPAEIRLSETDSKHFSGATDWNLIYYDFNSWGCPFTGEITPTNVEYKAHLDGEKLYLDFTIQEFTETVTAHCDDPEQGNPPPIIYTVPAGTGTVSVPSQGGVTNFKAGMGGGYWIIVTRVSEEGTGP